MYALSRGGSIDLPRAAAFAPLGFLEPTLQLEIVASTAESLAMRVRVEAHSEDVSEVVLRLTRSQLEGAADRLRDRLAELDV
jgi:hypothetical protein